MDAEEIFHSPLFVGAAGALVSLRFSLDENWRQRLATFISGTVIAGYTARGLCEWLKLSHEVDLLAIAFAIGLLGLSMIAAVFKAIRAMDFARILTSWLARR